MESKTLNVSLTRISSNVKTGPIPVSTSTKGFCPNTCPLKDNGCYAASGPVAIHWKKITNGERGKEFLSFCEDIKALPKSQLWRHNVAGDLPSDGRLIDQSLMTALINANKGRNGFTYTHHDVSISENAEMVEKANKSGFTVNLSANNMEQADKYMELGIGPVVTLLPPITTKTCKTPAGNTVVVCPAALDDSNSITCSTCQFCQKSNRKVIIGFPVHGTGKKKALKVIESI